MLPLMFLIQALYEFLRKQKRQLAPSMVSWTGRQFQGVFDRKVKYDNNAEQYQ